MFSLLLFCVLSILAFFLLKKKWGNEFRHKKIIQGLWIIKWIGMITMTAWYTHSGNNLMRADVYKYFHDAEVLYPLWLENPSLWLGILTGTNTESQEAYLALNQTEFYFHGDNHWTNDDRMMIRIHMIIRIFSGGNQYIHGLVFLLFGIISSLYFCKKWKPYSGIPEWLLLLFSMGLPSVIFWCGGALKETLLLGCLFLGIGSFIPDNDERRKNIMLFILSGFILFMIRPVLILIWIPAILTAWLVQWNLRIRFFALVFLLLMALMAILHIPEIAGLLINKRNELVIHALQGGAGSMTNPDLHEPNGLSLIALMPIGLMESIFSPFFPISKAGILGIFFGFEIAILLFLIPFLKGKQNLPTFVRFLAVMWITASLFYLLIVGVTSPVAGAIVRYRSVVIPWIALGIAELYTLRFFIFIKNIEQEP